MDSRRFLRPFLALFGLGLAGTVALSLALRPVFEQMPPHVRGALSVEEITALSLIQPALLALLATAVGVWLARPLGLRSHIAAAASGEPAGAPGLGSDLLAGAAAGALLAPALVLVEAALAGGTFRALPLLQPRTLGATVAAVLYGGITEELTMRYGGMTLLAWLLWRLSGRRDAPPGPGILWTAILAMALVFGAGHLGAAALAGPLTGAVVLRTVLLNALAGVLFGWLYFRRSLEAAMAAHGAAHVAWAALAWLAAFPGAP